MAIARLSNEYINNGYALVENIFISDFAPSMSEYTIKVYLYSVFLAQSPKDSKNTLDIIKNALAIDDFTFDRAIEELKDDRLIRIVSNNPLEFEILPLKDAAYTAKKYKPEKYSDFTTQLQQLFPERVLMPNDYIKYFELIEEYKIAPEALIMVATYCVRLKTAKVHHNYILTVAKAWAQEGATTVDTVEEKLQEMESNTDSLRQIFQALGLKSAPDALDKQLFIKWNKSWGYDFEAILQSAKLCKRTGGMNKLDNMLDKLYRLGLFTSDAVKHHAKHLERMRALAIEVNKKLGLFYQDLDNIIETYIASWVNKGFEDDAIVALGGYCFKHNVRTLDSMDSIMEKFYKNGLITLASINQHIDNSIARDKKIKFLLDICGSLRGVRESDRASYTVWVDTWGFGDDVLEYAATLSQGKAQPFAYINHLLTTFKNSNKKTLAECKSIGFDSYPKSSDKSKGSARYDSERNYTKEELDSIFGDISDPNNIDF